MRVLIDVICPGCGETHTDVWIERERAAYPSCRCGSPMERHWASAPTVRPDDIPGGLTIHHGLCHEDGSPRTYYSQSEITRECQARGLRRWTDVYSESVLKPSQEWGDWKSRSPEARQERADRHADRARRRR